MAVWEQVSAQGYRPSAWQVKRLLTEERVPGASAVARFVGVEAYEAAGGQVLPDLFARDDKSGVWFEDPVLLEKLATGKLQAAADELSTRWKWAIAMIEVEWGDTARYGRIEPAPAERTPEEQAEIERLEARQAELAELDDEAWTEELFGEAESIETRLDEIEGGIEARATWRRVNFGMAGCIVTIAHDGTLQVIHGLVRPEETGVGIGLADGLRSIRTALVKAYLAGNFEAAFDLMLFQLGRSVFTDGYRAHTLDITVRETADPPAQLRPWRPATADVDDWREPPKLAVPLHGALVMDCDPEPPEAQAFWRAAERAGMATSLFETDRRLTGYDWYDGLDRVTGIATMVAADGEWCPLDAAGKPSVKVEGGNARVRIVEP